MLLCNKIHKKYEYCNKKNRRRVDLPRLPVQYMQGQKIISFRWVRKCPIHMFDLRWFGYASGPTDSHVG